MFSGKISRLSALALVLALASGCGKDKTQAPPPAAPPGGQPPVGGGALGPINQQPAGTPLSRTSDYATIMRAMAQNLTGSGIATASSITSVAYALEYLYRGPQLTQISQPQNEPMQATSYRISGQGNPYSMQFSIQLQDAYGRDGGSYEFTSHVSIEGLILESTDQIAFFQGQDGEILKVAYRNPNPSIARYAFQRLQGNAFQPTNQGPQNRQYSSVTQISVYQQNLNTNFQPSYTNYYGGGQPQPGFPPGNGFPNGPQNYAPQNYQQPGPGNGNFYAPGDYF